MYLPTPLLRILSTTPLPADLHVNSLLIYLLHYLLFNLRRVIMFDDSHASTSFCCRFYYYASYYSFRSHLARAAS